MNVRKPLMIAIHNALWVVAVVAGLGIFAGSAGVAYAQSAVQKYWSDNYGVSPPAPDGKFYRFSRLAKAQPDECFDSTNPQASYQSFFLTYPGDLAIEPNASSCVNAVTRNPGVLKTNQAYLWGFTNWGSDLWFGTIANTLCVAAEGLGATNFPNTNTVYCNGKLAYDIRAPRIFLYDTKKGELIDMTRQVLGPDYPKTLNQNATNLIQTIGLRSAGSKDDVVFLGGVSPNGVTMFAFNGRTRTFIGSKVFNNYSNIRQWIVTNNQLYVGVAVGTGSGLLGGTTGAILRWKGTVNNPFQFDIVGDLNADPAYLTRYQDRLFVTTWGGCIHDDGNGVTTDPCYGTQLYMSPQISKLSSDTRTQWQVVWKYSDYEVEPSAGMAGGAVMAHDGWLYWTTMIPPGYQNVTFNALYPNAPSPYGFLGSYRPTSMFRGKFLDSTETKRQVQLVYGNAMLPKYVKTADISQGCEPGKNGDTSCQWTIVPNNMGQKPLYGLSGYNNFFNSYTWWMHVYNGELFIGTFDWSYLLFESLFDIYNNPSPGFAGLDLDFGAANIIAGTDTATIPPAVIEAARLFEGADLLRIHNSNDPAYVVSLNGVGNFSNYGVRNMLQVGSELFIGTANPFNLLNPPTNVNYDNQLGGWELLHLKPTDAWYQTYCPNCQ